MCIALSSLAGARVLVADFSLAFVSGGLAVVGTLNSWNSIFLDCSFSSLVYAFCDSVDFCLKASVVVRQGLLLSSSFLYETCDAFPFCFSIPFTFWPLDTSSGNMYSRNSASDALPYRGSASFLSLVFKRSEYVSPFAPTLEGSIWARSSLWSWCSTSRSNCSNSLSRRLSFRESDDKFCFDWKGYFWPSLAIWFSMKVWSSDLGSLSCIVLVLWSIGKVFLGLLKFSRAS